MNNMRKLSLATALSAAFSPAAFAQNYNGEAYASLLNALDVNAGSPHDMYYVSDAAGIASNTSGTGIDAPIALFRASGWTFDFTDLSAVAFTGYINMGNYKVQTNVETPSIDGRVTYTGVVYSFSGVGSYDEATNTFTYTKLSAGPNTGGGSVYSSSAPASCDNGRTNFLGKVCDEFAGASRDWEGLALKFFFSEDRAGFGGQLQGVDRTGTGIHMNTTTINWAVEATVPVPAAAWLFGSGLLGMAGAAARRRRHG